MVELADSYPNPPITQVAFELKFPIQLSIPSKVADFQKSIREDFPIVKQGELRSAEFDVVRQETRTALLGLLWEFRDKEEKNVIRLSSGNLIILTQQHKNYTDLKQIITIGLERLIAILGDECPLSTRIGLRYTNHCLLNEEIQNSFSNFFYSPVSDLFSDPSKLIEMQIRIVEQMEKAGLTTQAGFVTDPIKKERRYVLDFDAFITEQVEFNKILEILDQLHSIIRQAFSKHIKERYVKEIMEKED